MLIKNNKKIRFNIAMKATTCSRNLSVLEVNPELWFLSVHVLCDSSEIPQSHSGDAHKKSGISQDTQGDNRWSR